MADGRRASARKALREATAGCHERVDAVFSRFDLSRRGDYAAFLGAQAAAFGAVEPGLEAGGIASLVADWPARQRLAMLLADLAALGVAAPEPLPAPELVTEAELLGGLYVLEGSRLGGALLRRSVGDGLPASFLTPGDPGSWRGLIELLDARLTTVEDIATATRGAERVFCVFERAGQRAREEMTASG